MKQQMHHKSASQQKQIPNVRLPPCFVNAKHVGQGAYGHVFAAEYQPKASLDASPTSTSEQSSINVTPTSTTVPFPSDQNNTTKPTLNNPQASSTTTTTGGLSSGVDLSKELIAIKVIENYGQSMDYLKRTRRELAILSHFQYVAQVVELQGAWIEETPIYNPNMEGTTPPPQGEPSPLTGGGDGTNPGASMVTSYSTSSFGAPVYTRRDLYMVMEYVEKDLAALFRSPTIGEKAIRSIVAQLLIGLAELHEKCGPHRDLTPKNILVDSKNSVFICDFGFSRFCYPDEQMSYGVITQWYRAPEVITDCRYDAKVDVWSVGVICAELFFKDHLLQGKNKDVVDQLNKIITLLGVPKEEWLTSKDHMFASASQNAKEYLLKCLKVPNLKAKGLRQLRYAVTPSEEAFDFIEKTVCFDPVQRLSAKDALQHPWFRNDPAIVKYIDEQTQQTALNLSAQQKERNGTELLLSDPKPSPHPVSEQDLVESIVSVVKSAPDVFDVRDQNGLLKRPGDCFSSPNEKFPPVG